jgi:O-antigen ligase
MYLFLLPVATAPKDIAFALLLGYACLRLHCTWRSYTCLLTDRLGWLLAAWTAWHAVSLLWSEAIPYGLDELKAFRVVVTPLLLWPVIDHLGWYIGAFLVGVLAQNGVQALQALRWFGLHPAESNRLTGLLHPIQTGTFCAAALCWHLAAAIRARGWLRWVSLIGMFVAGAGLVFSGSRGPWIGAAVAVAALAAVTAIRYPRTRRAVAGTVAAGLLAGAVLWLIAGDFVSQRFEQALSDLALARQGERSTDVGARLAVYENTWRAFLEAPIGGTGPGDLGRAIRSSGDIEVDESGHAHSLYLHELGSTGAVGFLLAAAALAVALARTFRDREDTHWSMGTPYVLIGWLVAAMFDAYQLNGLMFGLFGFIAAITVPRRPRSRGPDWQRSATAPGQAAPSPGAPGSGAKSGST